MQVEAPTTLAGPAPPAEERAIAWAAARGRSTELSSGTLALLAWADLRATAARSVPEDKFL